MPDLPFIGRTREDADNPQNDPARLVNYYREPSGGRGQYALKAVLGMVAYATTDNVFCRAMAEIKGLLYAVVGGTFMRVEEDGTVTTLGTVTDSAETTISSNYDSVTIAAGGTYYVWDGTTLSQPTGGQFDSIGSVTFLGQRTVMSEKDGRRVQWSALLDPADISGSDTGFATAESQDDNCVRVAAVSDVLWIMKQKSIERWGVSTGGDVFTPIVGADLDVGLMDYRLMCRFPNGIFWVGSDGVAYICGAGGQAQPVSSPFVETEIKFGTPTGCFFYEDEGHKFCAIRFENGPAWVCDISTGEWHERSEGANYQPWSAKASAYCYGEWIVGTDSGVFASLNRQGTDLGQPLVCEATSSVLEVDRELFIVALLELFPQVGRSSLGRTDLLGLNTGYGQLLADGEGNLVDIGGMMEPRPAYLTVEVSRDNGETWGDPVQLSMGDQGEYWQRVKMNALGQFRSICVRVTFSEPDDAPIEARANLKIAQTARRYAA